MLPEQGAVEAAIKQIKKAADRPLLGSNISGGVLVTPDSLKSSAVNHSEGAGPWNQRVPLCLSDLPVLAQSATGS